MILHLVSNAGFIDYAPTTFHLMGWLSKIFKGSNHKVSEGRCDWSYEADTVENHPSTSWDSWSEIEDIDRAIALSLSEEDQRGNSVIDSEPQLEEDELLARALQESLNVESPPEICAGCNTEIGHGRFLSCMSAVWHPECFRCHGCSQPISDYEFSMSGSYPYHKACYKESYHPKCDICNHFVDKLQSIAIGLTRSLKGSRGADDKKMVMVVVSEVLKERSVRNTVQVTSMMELLDAVVVSEWSLDLLLLQSLDARFAALNDGRKLCLECLDSAIMDTDECQPLFLDIQEFYEGLNMKVTQQVPLLLVERQALNEAMDGERHGHHHMPETRGLCLSEEQTVSSILRRPRTGGGNRVMGMRTEPYKLTRHCFRTLRQDVEEGICQVLASMWLESQILYMSDSNNASTSSSSSAFTSSRQGARSPFEKKLSVFFKHQIATDTSVVYGNGFRAGNQAVLKFGLQRTLDHIRETGNFPY
ncbi:hypothetical protein DH2020_035089 [Rehmannia glutinosa]|uniref:LIM zinc-binding domain-containing protein n=1 Tax=Rehmannia glutinosa TaxID=99300 RepID=A0ABR0V7I1_REHGL